MSLATDVLAFAAAAAATDKGLRDDLDALAASGVAIEHAQTTPSASWIIAHPFGRLPVVAVFIGGELVDTDVTATTTTVTVTFPAPATGIAVLT